jgi:hypothetical protein
VGKGFGTWDVEDLGWQLLVVYLAEVQGVKCSKNGIEPPNDYTFLYGKVRVWGLVVSVVRNDFTWNVSRFPECS